MLNSLLMGDSVVFLVLLLLDTAAILFDDDDGGGSGDLMSCLLLLLSLGVLLCSLLSGERCATDGFKPDEYLLGGSDAYSKIDDALTSRSLLRDELWILSGLFTMLNSLLMGDSVVSLVLLLLLDTAAILFDDDGSGDLMSCLLLLLSSGVLLCSLLSGDRCAASDAVRLLAVLTAAAGLSDFTDRSKPLAFTDKSNGCSWSERASGLRLDRGLDVDSDFTLRSAGGVFTAAAADDARLPYTSSPEYWSKNCLFRLAYILCSCVYMLV